MLNGGSLCSSSTTEDYEIHFDHRLGKGGFGEVFLARHLSTSRDVAMKIVSKLFIKQKSMEKRVWDEVRIHSQLKHPRIVELLDCFQDENHVYIVLEFCASGDVRKYLKAMGRPFDETNAAIILEQVVDGVMYLHGQGVIHRDLSASNIFLDKDWNVKIGDFGLATQISEPNEKHFTMCGTPNYIAPEIAMHKPHGLEADIWSLGCLLYTFLCGHPPFGSNGQVSTTLKRIMSNQLELPRDISTEAAALIRDLMCSDANRRIKLRSIHNHVFFRKYRVGRSYMSGSSMDSGHYTLSAGLTPSVTGRTRISRSLDRRYCRTGPVPVLAPLRSLQPRSACIIPTPLPAVPGAVTDEEAASALHAYSRSCSHQRFPTTSSVLCPCAHSVVLSNNLCARCGQATQVAYVCGHSHLNEMRRCVRCGEEVPGPLPSPRNPGLAETTDDHDAALRPAADRYSPMSDDVFHDKPPAASRLPSCFVDGSGRTLSHLVKPLNARRLRPTHQATKLISLSILEDSAVVVHLFNRKRNSNEVVKILADGQKVIIYKVDNPSRNKTCPLEDANISAVYTFDTLPVRYWKSYQVAAKFVDLVRAKTPKVTLYTNDCKCALMENGGFELQGPDGRKVARKPDSPKWFSISEGRRLSASEHVADEQLFGKCRAIEKCLEKLQTANDNYFPVVVGRRSGTKMISMDSKENESPARDTRNDSEALKDGSSAKGALRESYVPEFECFVRELREGGIEILYKNGERLRLLQHSEKIEHSEPHGVVQEYGFRSHLPEKVRHRLSQINEIMRMYSQNAQPH